MTNAQAEKLKNAFLTEFRVLGNVSAACKIAGVKHRTQVYAWQEQDDAFATAYRFAEIEATEVMEAEAFRRAVTGVAKTKVVTQAVITPEGEVTPFQEIKREEVTEYSDSLLQFLLRARAPEKYRERFDVTRSDVPMFKAIDAEDLAAV